MQARTYHGACHCGRVAFEVEGTIDHVVYCNCSICAAMGALWHGAPDGAVHITAGEEALAVYQFGTLTAKHYFCRHCGVHPLSRPRVAPKHWVVNVRCVQGVDVTQLPVRLFDGQNWEGAVKSFYSRVKYDTSASAFET